MFSVPRSHPKIIVLFSIDTGRALRARGLRVKHRVRFYHRGSARAWTSRGAVKTKLPLAPVRGDIRGHASERKKIARSGLTKGVAINPVVERLPNRGAFKQFRHSSGRGQNPYVSAMPIGGTNMQSEEDRSIPAWGHGLACHFGVDPTVTLVANSGDGRLAGI